MTSAQTFSGIGDRSSSRVLAPPGGGSTFNIFGGGNDAPTHTITGRLIRQPQQQQPQPMQDRPVYDNRQQPQQRQPEPYKQPQQQQQQQSFSSVRQPPRSPLQQNDNYNGGNGGGLHEGRSSTRLHAPPGGQSSMASILGGGGNDAPQQQNYGRGRRDPNASSFQPQQQHQPASSGAHTSVKMHQQPGGKSSGNIISWQ